MNDTLYNPTLAQPSYEKGHAAQYAIAVYMLYSEESEEFNEMHELDTDEQIPDASSSGRLNFLRRRLIFVGPQYAACCMSPF
jgi:hypothetical protein